MRDAAFAIQLVMLLVQIRCAFAASATRRRGDHRTSMALCWITFALGMVVFILGLIVLTTGDSR